jgi:hypothetical protein
MAGDDRHARLVQVRDQLAEAIAGCESTRDLPALSREYRLVLIQLAALDGGDKDGGTVGDLAKRRRARRSAET